MTPEQALHAATRAQEYTGENAADIGVGAVLGATGARGALR